MERKQTTLSAGITVLAGMMAGLIRLVPATYNFTPLGALGLFGGAKLKSWHAFALPIAVMTVTDLALWGITGQLMYSPFHLSRVYVYASLLGYVLIGKMLVKADSPSRILGASLLGSLQFFLVTNFCDWAFQPLMTLSDESWRYARDFGGLATCYLNGLPFYNGSSGLFFFGLFFGDLFFSGCLFGLCAFLTRPADAKELGLETIAPSSR